MVIVHQAGHALGHIGKATAPINEAVQQVNTITTQRLLQGERLKQREDELLAAQEAAAAKAQRESIEAVQKGLRSALDVTNDLGLGTDYNAFLAIDQELLAKDPEMYRQAVQATGFPKSDTGADYPIALTTRAEMLRSIREREQTGAKSRMADDFASQAELAGYTPDEVADVVTMAASNAEPAVLAAEIESIQAQADERRKVEMARDVGVAYAQRIKTEHPDLAHNNPDAYAIWTRLASGRSKDPMTDRARLSVMVEHGTESYHAIMADAFALGQAQARQQVARESQSYQPQGFDMAGLAPDAPPVPGEMVPSEPPGPSEPAQTPPPPVAEAPTDVPDVAPNGLTFDQWASSSGYDLDDPQQEQTARQRWPQLVASQERAGRFARRDVDRALSPGGAIHNALGGNPTPVQELKSILTGMGVDMNDREAVSEAAYQLANSDPRRWGPLVWGITYLEQ